MELRSRLESSVSVSSNLRQKAGVSNDRSYVNLKNEIHEKLLDRLDLTMLDKLPPEQITVELRAIIERLLQEQPVAINETERSRLVEDIRNEITGLGPLETLLSDPTISDILINSSTQIYVERRGRLELSPVQFQDDAHLMKIIDRIVSAVGRRIDESSPMVDARLEDGSRVNAIIPPLALDGPCMSIRKFSKKPMKMEDLIKHGALTAEMGMILEGLVIAKCNIIIAGGTGSGKTTLLNVLSSYIPSYERIITVEDAAELQLQQPHVVRLETRPANIEGKGAIHQRDLIINCLRMRPDRIIVGEVRGPEAFDMLQAMNTGHEGSLATIHANTPRDALMRMENMLSMAQSSLSVRNLRQQISSTINIIVQANRLSDGTRKVMSINEITGMEGETITMQPIFEFQREGVSKDGKVLGRHLPTGIRPAFSQRLLSHGITLPADMFDPARSMQVREGA